MQPEDEHALVLDTENGLVVLVGCSHPGVDNLVNKAKSILSDKPVHYVLGGFHLLHSTEDEIKQVISNFETELITPTHCSGDLAKQLIKEKYKAGYLEGGVGQRIELM